jgi:hypothetical protein
VALRAVLKVSLGYVALALMCCLPCGYVALRAMLRVILGYVASSTYVLFALRVCGFTGGVKGKFRACGF